MELTVTSLLEETLPVEAVHDAACYFPLESGRYEVKPGLISFGRDLGNGEADQRVFQLDGNFLHYRWMKELARSQRLSQYYQTYEYGLEVNATIAQFICDQLVKDYPQHFCLTYLNKHECTLYCQLTEETIHFDKNFQRVQVTTKDKEINPPYKSALDALAAQIQEDLTVVSRSNERHWVSAIHLCFPNHWAAEDKIGHRFAAVHAPVAGMDKINQRGEALVRTMIERPPAIRFAWGLSTDTRLNHHPKMPAGIALEQWQGRQFNLQNPRLYLRIERQVIWGFPAVNAALFTIRTSFRDCGILKREANLQSKLIAAIHSMSPDSLAYKGLEESKEDILTWLQNTSDIELQ